MGSFCSRPSPVLYLGRVFQVICMSALQCFSSCLHNHTFSHCLFCAAVRGTLVLYFQSFTFHVICSVMNTSIELLISTFTSFPFAHLAMLFGWFSSPFWYVFVSSFLFYLIFNFHNYLYSASVNSSIWSLCGYISAVICLVHAG